MRGPQQRKNTNVQDATTDLPVAFIQRKIVGWQLWVIVVPSES